MSKIYKERQILARMDAWQLEDIGLTRHEANREHACGLNIPECRKADINPSENALECRAHES